MLFTILIVLGTVLVFQRIVQIGLSQAQVRILTLWNEVLRSGQQSVAADFFDVGGDSLNAVQLINRINREIGGGPPDADRLRAAPSPCPRRNVRSRLAGIAADQTR